MNKLLTLIFISISIGCFGQALAKAENTKGLTTGSTAEKPAPTSLEKTILFSKGEAYTEKEWQDYRQRMLPLVKDFFKRDSSHNKFLSNTVAPNLSPGDSIESYSITLEGVFIKLKAKKNGGKN